MTDLSPGRDLLDEARRTPPVGSLPRVSVVVVSWDGRTELAKALDSLATQTVEPQVIIVDNGSVDGSAAMVRENYPGAILVELPDNRGFAGPNNIGLSHATAAWVLTLNNDVTFGPDFIATLLQAAEAAPQDVYALGAALVYADRPSIVQTLGIEPLPNGSGTNVGKNEELDNFTSTLPIFGACAGAALFRRSVLDEIGMFDARYFAYLEDVDLAHRAAAAGYRALSVPAAVGFHVHSYTAGRLPLLKLSLIERNRLLNLVKHYPRRALWLEPLTTLLLLLRFLFTADRAKVSTDQLSYLSPRNAPQVLRILVQARWYVIRHAREYRVLPVQR